MHFSAATGAGALRLPLLRSVMLSEEKVQSEQTQRRSQSAGAIGFQKEEDEFKTLQLVTGQDAIAFFARMGNDTPMKFVYCNRAETRDEFRPYDLVIVNRKQVEPEMFTISTTGVVHVQPNSPSEFISLADWMHEATSFNILRSIRFFRDYLIAKMFRLWRSNVRYRLYVKQRKQLSRNLFLARPSFCDSLLEVKKLMFEMDQIKLTKIKPNVSDSTQFVQDQSTQRNNATKKIEGVIDKLETCVEKVTKGVKERARAYDSGISGQDSSDNRFAQHLRGNDKSKSMVSVKKERAERIRRLKHAALEADMLGDFIRLVDYMEVEHLVGLVTSTIGDLYHQLQHRKSPLFVTVVSFQPEDLLFQPAVKDFCKILGDMKDAMISGVDSIERILWMSKFKPYVSNQLNDSPKVEKIIRNDRFYQDTREVILQKVEDDFRETVESVVFLEKYRPVYEFGRNWDFQAYCDAGHSVESIQKDMTQQTEWATEVERIRQLYEVGIFQAETRGLKFALLPVTKDTLNDMKELLLRIFHNSCIELQSLYQEKIKSLDEEPETLPVYAAHVKSFRSIREEGKDMHVRAERIEHVHNLLIDHQMKIPAPDAGLFYSSNMFF